jgi:uncharacterized protein
MKLTHTLVTICAFILSTGLFAAAEGPDASTALLEAAKVGSMEAVKQALGQGADVNAAEKDSGLTPLICATLTGNADVVKLLLEKGANVNAKTSGGVTALMAAGLDANKLDLAKLLIEKGAEVNAKTASGLTALKYAEFPVNAEADGQQRAKASGLVPKGAAPESKPAESAMIDLLKQHGAQ